MISVISTDINRYLRFIKLPCIEIAAAIGIADFNVPMFCKRTTADGCSSKICVVCV